MNKRTIKLKSQDKADTFYIGMLKKFEDDWFAILEKFDKEPDKLQMALHTLAFDFSTRLLKESYI